MARLRLIEHALTAAAAAPGQGSWPSMPASIGLFAAVVVLVAICAHQPEKTNSKATTTDRTTSSKKLEARTLSRNKINPSQKKRGSGGGGDDHAHEIRVDFSAVVPPLRSPPPPPPPPRRKSSKDLRRKDGGGGGCEKKGKVATGGFGEGGLWQKSILRGEKCQLPEFSGVIFYDSRGNQIQVAAE